MGADEKLVEMFLKYSCGMYTGFDALKDFGDAVIELTVKDPIEKKDAKLMLSTAKEMAEKLNDNEKIN